MRKFKLMTVRNERQFRACTGLSQEEFDRLFPEFAMCLQRAQRRHYQNHRSQRKRKPGGGRKGALFTPDRRWCINRMRANFSFSLFFQDRITLRGMETGMPR